MYEELDTPPTEHLRTAAPTGAPAADLEALRLEQNLPLAWLAGALAAITGAVVWAVVTVVTEYQIGWMAVGVGALVGFAVRHLGKGVDSLYGYVGAGWALFGCALGNLLTVCAFVAREEGISIFQLLPQLTFGIVAELMTITFSPMDLLFYGLAVHAGYRIAVREVPAPEEPS